MQAADAKTILVDIGHPGHVHLYRVAIHAWKAAGHRVVVAIRDRGLVPELLTAYGIEHEVVSRVKTSFAGLVYELLEHDWGVVRMAIRHKADVLTGTSVCITHAGFLLRRPSVVLNEDDKHYLHAWSTLAYPIASAIVTPFALTDTKTPKYICHNSLHELAYLHPDHFTPDPTVLDELGLAHGERFFIVRFVALQAHHDFSHRGLSVEQRLALLRLLEQYGRVFVSDEALPASDRGRYRLLIHPSRIHHVMYYATLLVGDSQTMAVEAAVLGTTAFRCNTFVRECSIINELDDRYGLIRSYHPRDFDRMMQDLLHLLDQPDLPARGKERRERLLRDKGNFANFVERVVLDFKPAATRGPRRPGDLPSGPDDLDLALKLLEWMRARNWQGIDPYLLDAKLNAMASSGLRRALMRRVRTWLKPFHSLIPRRVFGMAAPVLMPKVLGLALSGLAGLSVRFEPRAYQSVIDGLVKQLLATRSARCRELAWGQPFSWGGAIRYAPDTPSVPVTALIAHGLMDILETGRVQGLQDELKSIARYFLEENGSKDLGESLCFYYAPDNPDLTYNTSLLAASYLLRLDRHLGTEAYAHPATRALRFVLEGQNADGSWFYTDVRGDTPLDTTIDGRHTGFILEHLARIRATLPADHALQPDLAAALAKGTHYYLTQMMEGPIPRWAPGATFPVDIKDVAQAIITLAVLGDTTRARRTLDFAYEKFFDGSDAFWFKLQHNGQVNRTVFIRWNQAWMFKAIGVLLHVEALIATQMPSAAKAPSEHSQAHLLTIMAKSHHEGR